MRGPVEFGVGTPTGSVTFGEGETVSAIVPLVGPIAQLGLKGLEPGEPPVTATYAGDGNYPLKAFGVGTHEVTTTYGGAANHEGGAGTISEVITP